MTARRRPHSNGAGRQAGSVPLGPRSRARRLYRARRKRLLEVPVAALRQRFGDRVELDDQQYHHARVDLGPRTVEVGFAGTHRMFGALIDTQWVGERGRVGSDRTEMEYRFDKARFMVKRGADTELAGRAANATTRELASRSELKQIRVLDDGTARQVQIRPLAGTITAVYFPPMPPYSVPLKPAEARDHLELLLHLLDL